MVRTTEQVLETSHYLTAVLLQNEREHRTQCNQL